MLSHALYASFADTTEQRASDRRVLRLDASAATQSGEGAIRVHNLSRTGMLGESVSGLPIGTEIAVELPGGAHHRAEVVWTDAELFGCRFAKPLSQATLSAALLRAAPSSTGQAEAALLVDSEAMARLREHWQFEDEVVSAPNTKLSLAKRMWVIVGLGLAAWAIPTAGAALLIF